MRDNPALGIMAQVVEARAATASAANAGETDHS